MPVPKDFINAKTLLMEYRLAALLILVSSVLVLWLADSISYFSFYGVYDVSLYVSALLASLLFYRKRRHFNIWATALQVFLSAYFCFLLTALWMHPAILLYLPVLLMTPAIGLLLLAVFSTPLSFVLSKLLTDLLFFWLNVRPRDKDVPEIPLVPREKKT